jgi:TPR repeat protein
VPRRDAAVFVLGVCAPCSRGVAALGRGVPRDDVLGYMWLILAAAKGDPDASLSRDGAFRTMVA